MARGNFSIKVDVDHSKLRLKIAMIEARAKNLRPWFDDVATAIAMAQRINFATHGSLAGGWAPLSPEYGVWKHSRKPGRPLMIDTGKLAESLTSKHRLVLSMGLTKMTVGSDVSYATFHQHGTRHMPSRKILVIPDSLIRTMQRELVAYIAKGKMRSGAWV